MNISQLFTEKFNSNPDFTVRSPGRVNLIGEHIDYNDGFVLPMAIPLQTEMAVAPRVDETVRLYSPIFNEERQFQLSDLKKTKSWIDYAQAVASVLGADGVPLRGFDGVVSSDLPLGSGLSSSASLEVAVALVFLHLAGVEKSRVEIALMCQRAENGFIGLNSGIMDQMAVAACTANHALLLDCRSLFMEQVPFVLQNHAVVVTDSAAPRELASSAYNERRAQCEAGLAILQKSLPNAKSLRDVSTKDLERFGAELPEIVRQRVTHIVDEIARTQQAVDALKRGDLAEFGAKMNESHASLRDLYEVSSAELDFLTDWARQQPGVLGSRMTGAGFGGCTVTLIEKNRAESFIDEQIRAYKTATNRDARGWVCEATEGAQVLA